MSLKKTEKTTIDVVIERVDGLKILMEEKFCVHDGKLDEIRAQTTKTNGTVAEIQIWRQRAMGAVGILGGIFLPLIVGIITYLLYLHIR